jgi:hypothetical protein
LPITLEITVMNTLVLYLRPMWREGDGDYDAAWNDLVAALTDAWTDRLAWRETLSDRTLALLVEEPLFPLAMAMDAFDILGRRIGAPGARGFPIQMLISIAIPTRNLPASSSKTQSSSPKVSTQAISTCPPRLSVS